MIMKNHFKQIQAFKPDYASVDISQFESERTGMRVVVAQREGPKIEGKFIFATEIHDDSGAPHTLEHLCFMGSKNYPYKGMLDKLASRAYSYTNASTSTDCTEYELSTAGWDGFAQILPIYLEHLLFPTLADSAFHTEVHHVDGEGNDAGTVYSEMQSWENEKDSLMNLRLSRVLYPEENGYRYETGGMLGYLRSLTNDRIRKFHKDMYQPRNLCLSIVGDVDKDQLFKVLNIFESSVLEEIPSLSSPFKRPWVDTDSAVTLQRSLVEEVSFPEDDESVGAIDITFLGPSCTDVIEVIAAKLMLEYLCETSLSILNNTIVEQEHLASDFSGHLELRKDSLISINVLGVAKENLRTVERRIFEVLQETANKTLNMNYLKECIKSKIRMARYGREMRTSPYEKHIRTDHLYGNRDGSYLLESLGSLKAYYELESWEELKWRNFLKRWIADAYHISILGSPSAIIAKELKESEEARIEQQKAKYGEKGLEELAAKLNAAKEENEKPIPSELIGKFEVPGTQSIRFVSTTTARAGTAKNAGNSENGIQKLLDADSDQTKLFLHFENAKMNFVNINITFSMSVIPTEIKPLLFIFARNYYDTPVVRNGERIGYEEVHLGVKEQATMYGIWVGSWDDNEELLTVTSLVEPENYSTIIRKHKELLFDSIIDIERVKSAVKKLIAELPEQLRQGDEVTNAVDMLTHFTENSNNRTSNPIVAARYFKSVEKLLETDPQVVIERMEKLRQCLYRVSNMHIAVNGDIESIPCPVSSWDALIEGAPKEEGTLIPLDTQRRFLNDRGRNPGGLSHIVPMAATDSSYALFTAKGLASREDPRWPALLIAMEYLQVAEGVLWVAIRGQGLAYHFGVQQNIDRGSIQFIIYMSPKTFSAYTASRDIIRDIASGKTPVEVHDLEGAISTFVLNYASRRSNLIEAGFANFINEIVRNLSKEESADLLKRVRDVTSEQIKDVVRDIILPLFDPQKADMAIACAKIMTEDLKTQFEGAGFKPEVRTLKSYKDEYGIGEGENTDEESDDDEEDGDESDENDENKGYGKD